MPGGVAADRHAARPAAREGPARTARGSAERDRDTGDGGGQRDTRSCWRAPPGGSRRTPCAAVPSADCRQRATACSADSRPDTPGLESPAAGACADREPCGGEHEASQAERREPGASGDRSVAGRRNPGGRWQAGVGDDAAVEHLDPARQPRGEVAVVRDDDDRGSACVKLVEQRHDRGAGGAVEVAGRLVGEHDRRLADERARDRDALTLAARELCRAKPSPWPRPTLASASAACSRRSGDAAPGVEQPVARRSPAPSRARRGRTAGTRTRSASRAAPRAHGPSAARHRGRSAARCPELGRSSVPIRCSKVDFPEPDGPDDRDQLAAVER